MPKIEANKGLFQLLVDHTVDPSSNVGYTDKSMLLKMFIVIIFK